MKNSLINRFLKKKLTREELKNLHEGVNRNEKSFLESIEADWESFEADDLTEWDDNNWNKIQPLLKEEAGKEPAKVFRLYWLVRVAAAFLVFISVWLIFKYQSDTNSEDEFPALITEVNDSEEPTTVILKDGTKVILTAHSSLSYYENFNNRYRVVHLEGEAFFETDLKNNRPFIVISDNITSICRGNEFSISAFKDSDEIFVTLSSGHIEISQNDKLNSEVNKVDVKSCQRYSFNKTSRQYLIGQIEDCEYDKKVQSIKNAASKTIVML